MENAAHSIIKTVKKHRDWRQGEYAFEANPKEYARIDGDAIVFPMTGYNYRMIVLYRTP